MSARHPTMIAGAGRTSRWLTAVTAAALLAQACGGSDGTSPSAPTTSAVEGTPSSARTPTDDLAGAKGIVFVGCGLSDWLVRVVDPRTGAEVARRGAPLPADVNVNQSCFDRDSAWVVRQSFDSNYGRMAVGVRSGQDRSVGFIDTRTGQLTDVTGRPASSGFGSRPAQDHRNPVFRPGGDELWFADLSDKDNARLASVPPSGGSLTERGPYAPKVVGNEQDTPFVLAPTTNAVVVYFAPGGTVPLPDPEGRRAIRYQVIGECLRNPARPTFRVQCKALRLYDLRQGVLEVSSRDALDAPATAQGTLLGTLVLGKAGDTPIVDVPVVDSAGADLFCRPVSWTGRSTVLFDSCGPENIRLGTLSDDLRSLSFQALVPPNQRQISNVVLSPDRTQVAFVADDALYVASTAGGSEPVKVAERFPAGGMAVEWRT